MKLTPHGFQPNSQSRARAAIAGAPGKSRRARRPPQARRLRCSGRRCPGSAPAGPSARSRKPPLGQPRARRAASGTPPRVPPRRRSAGSRARRRVRQPAERPRVVPPSSRRRAPGPSATERVGEVLRLAGRAVEHRGTSRHVVLEYGLDVALVELVARLLECAAVLVPAARLGDQAVARLPRRRAAPPWRALPRPCRARSLPTPMEALFCRMPGTLDLSSSAGLNLSSGPRR